MTDGIGYAQRHLEHSARTGSRFGQRLSEGWAAEDTENPRRIRVSDELDLALRGRIS